jgi:translocation and assembly module TamB
MLDEDLAGRFDATLALTGRDGRLEGALDGRLAGARGRGSPKASGVDGTVSARLAGDALTLTARAANAQGLRADADLTLPVAASAQPFAFRLVRDRPLRGRFSAQGQVSPLWDLLVGGERSLAGQVRTQGVLGGTLADPTATGDIAVDDGRFDDGQTGLSLRQVSLRAAFEHDQVNVTQASGVDGHGGSLAGSGRISLLRNGVSSFRLDLRRFRLIDNELAEASATGQATIDRAADGKVRLKGALTIDQANVTARLPTPSGVVTIDVVEKNRPAELAPLPKAEPAGGAGGWLLDVRLRAPGRIYLRGRGLDVELSLNAHVGGLTSDPQLTGTAHVVRGDYDFAGKRFEFDPESVVYLSQDASRIRLDLTASWSDPSLTANVHIGGVAAKPELTLTSTPALPSDEVLSQVLFGRSASQLSGVEAAQVASALSSLAGGGGFDVIGNLRTFAGLDRLAFGSDASSGVTVSGGKYLTHNVYLELTGGGRTGPSAQVEWRVKRNLSVVSKVAGEGDNALSIRWRRDY